MEKKLQTKLDQKKFAKLFEQAAGEEIASLRSANIKQYDLGLGRRQAVLYPEAVHYQEENGEWTEIDNTLVMDTDVYGRAVLRAKASPLKTQLAAYADSGALVRLESKGRVLMWSFEQPAAAVAPQVQSGATLRRERLAAQAQKNPKFVGRTFESLLAADPAELETAQEQRGDVLEEKSAVATYANVLPGVTARYTLLGGKLKEDLVVENAAALESLALRLPDEYDYATGADQSISVRDKRTEEELFRFLPPVVYDANGAQSLASVQLDARPAYIRLSYAMEEAFLAQAAFPLTIDPVVISSDAVINIEDTTLCQNTATNPYTESYMKIGVASSGQNFMGLLRFKQLAPLKASDTVISAQLRMRVKSSSSSNYISAHEVLAPWTVSSVNWLNFDPTNPNNVEAEAQECIQSASSGYVVFDLTNMYKHWCMNDESGASRNNGVVLRKPDNVSGNHYTELYSADASSSYAPTMYVNFVSHAGLEGWWQYESMSAGRAGTVYADLYNGNMVLEHVDTTMTGNRLPVSVNHYYNSCLTASNDFYCGYGWKTSMHQYVYSYTISGTDYYIWMDGDGTEHFFPKTGSAPYEDAEGMSLKLQPYSTYYIITDKSNTQMRFNIVSGREKAWLGGLRDSMENTVTLTYNAAEGQIAKITDPAGRETNFYYTNNLLSSITTPAAESGTLRTVYFTYATAFGCLTGIRYSELGGSEPHTQYTYNFPSLQLARAYNYDGTRVDIEYEPISLYNSAMFQGGATEQMRRVLSLEQVHAANSDYTATITQRGAKLKIDYQHMCTEVTAVEDASSDAGKKLTYQFNDGGNVVCVRDELGYARFTKYDSAIENTPSDSSRLQKAVVNLLVHPDLRSGWSQLTGASGDSAGPDTATLCLNMATMYLHKAAAGGETMYRQIVTLTAGKDYSLSAYVKTSGVTGTGAFMRIRPMFSSTNAPTVTSEMVTGTTAAATGNELPTDGWERLHMVYSVPADAGLGAYYIEFVHGGTGGNAWFGAPQLEEGTAANHVSILSNGNFIRTTGDASRPLPADWAVGANTGTSAANSVITPGAWDDFPAALSGKYMQVEGRPDKMQVGLTQEVYVTGSAGDIYVLGGWANAKSVPNATTTDKGFGFAARYYRMNNTWSEYLMLPMNGEWVGWQYGCFPLRVPEAYKRLEILCVYTKNANTAKFANLFLYREAFGESFGYDDDKNLISTATLAEQQAGMEYDAYDNLISYHQPGRDASVKYTMTYGSTTAEKQQHLLKTMETPMGVKEWYNHDSYGNVIAQKVQADNGTLKMQTGTTYTANGNYVTSQTDVRGKSVSIVPNANVGVPHSVTDANGQTVNYVYDASNRVTAVLASSGGNTYRNDYTYENDRIKTVKHNTTGSTSDVTYTFDYDDLGRKTTVKVGTQTLSTNVYENNRNGLLSEVQYGNGGKVQYSYDEYDRMTGMRYDTETTDRYTYEYGANGSVSRVKDNHLNREERVEYDMAGRPRQKTLRTNAGAELYRTTLRYDKYSNLTGFDERVNGAAYTTTYTYDNDNRPTSIQYGADTRKIEYTYDELGRIDSKTTRNGTLTRGTSYDYVVGNPALVNATTPLVASITQYGMDFSYTYDNVGNITSETREGVTTTYAYDSLGQLTRVNDPHDTTSGSTGTTWVYNYDLGGNITSKVRYAYTTGTLGTALETIPYSYTDSNWKDKLTAYNGQAITYDAIGNPLNDGTWTYSWEAGRRLAQMSKSGTTVQYQYDANGLRVGKIVNGTETTYTLHGKLLTHLKQGANEMHFYYDAQSRPAMVNFNGAYYMYLHNLQGDVVGLVDSSNNIVVEYKYDAWGRPTLKRSLTTAYDTLATLNPFRYRGYVYDEETGLYYLRSRFYNPVWGRFISCDNIAGVYAGLLSTNFYSYAVNNPVMNSDVDGQIASLWAYLKYRGEAHNAVTEEICKQNPWLLREFGIPGGRIDIISTKDGGIWEVKSLGAYLGTRAISRAWRQLGRYVGRDAWVQPPDEKHPKLVTTHISGEIIPPGKAVINDTVSALYIQVEPGIIVYELMETEPAKITAPVPAKESEPVPVKRRSYASFEPLVAADSVAPAATALVGAIVLGAIAGGIGGGMPMLHYNYYGI